MSFARFVTALQSQYEGVSYIIRDRGGRPRLEAEIGWDTIFMIDYLGSWMAEMIGIGEVRNWVREDYYSF